MKKIAFAVHGGAGNLTPFLRNYYKEIEQGLALAAQTGYTILEKGGSALDAVEEAVKVLEDIPLYNAGRGSSLNCDGKVEMDASIMDGSDLKAGAISMVTNIKNPISLARVILEETPHVFVCGYGALNLAKKHHLPLEEDNYFIVNKRADELNMHGTVGAVALDQFGNLAAGTSTGGIDECLPGRVGDSCIIGAGCYANNNTCAVSATGEGEYIIRGVVGNTVSLMMELKGMDLQTACDYVIHERNKPLRGDIGIISVSREGKIGISYNSDILKRAWIGLDAKLHVVVE